MNEQFTCQRCHGVGDGLTVGQDPMTGRTLCGRCRDEEWIERTLGVNWGEKTNLKTDPRAAEPLPEPTLEEALGAAGAKRYREDQAKKKPESGSNVEERIDKLEDTLNKILEKLGG